MMKWKTDSGEKNIKQIGLGVGFNMKSVSLGIFEENITSRLKELHWAIMCTFIKSKLLGIRYSVIIDQEDVFLKTLLS